MSETRALGHHGAGQDSTGAHPAGNGASGAGANARAGHGGSARAARRGLARPRPGGLRAARVAAALLVCAGALLASAGTARAQSETPAGPTPSDPTARHSCTADVLSARLTAGTGSGVAGFDATAGRGSLSKTGFSIPGKRYTVRALELVREGAGAGTLRLGFTTELESDHGLILHVGEARFALADSARLSGGRTVEWSGSGLGLTAGGTVDVRFAQRIRRVGGSKDIGTPVLRQTSRLPYAEGDTVRLSYGNTPPKRDCLPPPGAFRVTENGAEVAVREVSLQYATVVLTLERALAAGTEVRADYVPPVDNALQTSFGTMADAFAGVVVHNNTVAPQVEVQEPEPLVALTQISAPDVEYWSANLTVRDLGGGLRGCDTSGLSTSTNNCFNTATLTDDGFRHLNRRYRVQYFVRLTNNRLRVSFWPLGFVASGEPEASVLPNPAFKNETTLHIGNNIALKLSEATTLNEDAGELAIYWPLTTAINNAMTVGRTVRVRITGPDHAPEMPAHRQVAQVDENSGGGVVVRRVEDTGVSGGTPPYQFSLEGPDASRYDIDAETGNIITRAGVTYDHESTPECYNSAGFVGRCHKLTLRATSAGSGTTRLSATRPLWVRVMDKFEWEGHAAQEPGVVRLEWDSPGGAFFREYCPLAGYDVLYSPLDGTSAQRSFDAGTTSATLRGLYPGQEYVVRMRERHPERTPGSGCPFSGPLQWVRGTVRTNGHPGTGTAMPRISLVIPDLLSPDDINLPGSASLDVGEGTTQTMRVLVDLSEAEYFPRHDDGFALSLVYTWANRAPPGSTSRSEPAVLRQVAQRYGKRWVMDYRVDIPDGSAGNGPLDIEMSVRHMTRNGARVPNSELGRGYFTGGTRVRFTVCESPPCALLSMQDGEPAPGPLTAQWSPPPPATHNGTAFTVGLEFSEAVSASAEEVMAAVSAIGATVTGAALAEGSDRLWNLTVTPSGTEGVSLFLAATNDCADAGAICTAGGKTLSGGLAHAMLFTPWLSVEDAEATEGTDATMDFTVTLAPAAGGTVTVDYATSDGTATEPADYASTTGTLTFTAGQTTKTVSVPIVDDDTPDSGETFTLTLGDVGGTEIVDIVDATATGTILNHEAPAGPLTGFTLVDASTNADVGTIADGATFTLPAPANGSYGVRVETSGNAEFGSVKLALSGARTVTQTESVAPWSLYGDDGTNVAGAGLPAGSYTLTATAHAEAGGQGEALQTLAVSFTVAAAPPPLTVAWTTDPPAEHDGSTAFSSEFSFSENLKSGFSWTTIAAALEVTQGGESLTPYVRRKTEGGGNDQHWVVEVTPDGYGDISIGLSASASCGDDGAICASGNRALSNALATKVVQGPLTLSVQDATAAEAAGATVDFTVTLSRASAETVTVDYATSNGTATAESDYTATSGTLTFAADDLSKTVSVPVLDDAVDEESETFTLTLSDAEGGNVHLADATATGTITNDDPMPRAWLARLGRTLAGQAVDMVAARLEGGGATQVTVGGQRLDLSGGAAAPAEEEEDVRGALEALGLGEEAPAGTPRTLSARELLLGSSFDLGAGGEGGVPAWAAWGRVATGGFDAAEDGVRLSGSVTSAFLGADVARGRWLAGLALSLSEGEGDYAHAETGSGGEVESRLTALYPYARLSVTERLDVWGLAGIGEGELALTHAHRSATAPGSRVLGPGAHPEAAEAQRWGADIAMRMGAVGVRGEVLSPAAPGGLALAVRSDALWVRTSSDAVRASYGNLGAAQADATRLRLALEGSRSFEAGAGALTPRLEVGLRHDGGDAETGSGVELGASVRYEGAGVSAEGAVRTLVAHESQGYEEWGASGALRIAPDASGRGLSLTLAPAVGASSSGGAQRLWSAADARALAPGGAFEAARRLEAELGYGFAMGSGSYTGTPTLGLGLTGASREVRVGWRLAEARSAGLVFGLDVEGVRREGAGGEAGCCFADCFVSG